MTEYLTEQEQIEQLKRWFRIYGIPALIGIVAGIIIFYGWNHYQNARLRVLSHASGVYDEMLNSRAHHQQPGTVTQAQKLLNHYAATPYGALAALMLAEEAISQHNYPEALKQLSWTLDHSHTAAIRQIARLRIARIHIENQQPEEALQWLAKIDDPSFMGLIDEIRGDAYLAMHRQVDAQEAYKKALQELPNAEEIRPLLEMKLDNLT